MLFFTTYIGLHSVSIINLVIKKKQMKMGIKLDYYFYHLIYHCLCLSFCHESGMTPVSMMSRKIAVHKFGRPGL